MYISPVLDDSLGRLEDLKRYIREAGAGAGVGTTNFSVHQYSSWVLLTYASVEGAVVQFGEAIVKCLGVAARMPSDLPETMRVEHYYRMLKMLSQESRERLGAEEFRSVLSSVDGAEWAQRSNLMSLERNAWPDEIRSWLSRLGIGGEQLRWFNSPIGSTSETAASRLKALVQERNDIAHGALPQNLLTGESMCAWIDEIAEIVLSIYGTLISHLGTAFPILLSQQIGDVDEAASGMSSSTMPLKEIGFDVRVGDRMLLRGDDDSVSVARVKSMFSDGRDMEYAPAGSERVAVCFNRSAEGCVPFRPF